MRNIKFLPLFVLFVLNNLLCFAQPDISESDPHRGMYINRFLKYNTLTINSGANDIDTSNSILSIDVNHDGIFEKEDRVLQYCLDNHITTIVLYDLRNILGRGILAWNENDNQFQDLEEHLCRFMEKARIRYCINEIGAAGQGQGFWSGIQDAFTVPTPALRFSNSERSMPSFSPFVNLADTMYEVTNPLFGESEELKYFLRVGRFALSECSQRFNLLHEEYEFWNENDLPTNTVVDPSCTLQNCVACTNPNGNFVYPNIYEAGYYRVFVRALKKMKEVKIFLNTGLNPTDPNYIKTEVYFQSPNQGFTVDEIEDLYSFIDGNPDQTTSIAGWSDCQKNLFDLDNEGLLPECGL